MQNKPVRKGEAILLCSPIRSSYSSAQEGDLLAEKTQYRLFARQQSETTERAFLTGKRDYTYQVIEEPTEEATGLGRYTWKNTAYGEFAVDVVLDRTSATLPGDMSGDGVVTDKDVIALLWHVLFPNGNPIHGEGDINGDGVVTDKDVIALLWHVLFPNAYPL